MQADTKKRLRWKCRRGMLELDLVFLPFLESGYEQLTEAQQQTFDRMLDEDDPVLQSWIMQQIVPEDQAYAELVLIIKKHASLQA